MANREYSAIYHRCRAWDRTRLAPNIPGSWHEYSYIPMHMSYAGMPIEVSQYSYWSPLQTDMVPMHFDNSDERPEKEARRSNTWKQKHGRVVTSPDINCECFLIVISASSLAVDRPDETPTLILRKSVHNHSSPTRQSTHQTASLLLCALLYDG